MVNIFQANGEMDVLFTLIFFSMAEKASAFSLISLSSNNRQVAWSLLLLCFGLLVPPFENRNGTKQQSIS